MAKKISYIWLVPRLSRYMLDPIKNNGHASLAKGNFYRADRRTVWKRQTMRPFS